MRWVSAVLGWTWARALRAGRIGLRLLVPLVVLLILGVALIFFVFPAADLWFVWKVYRGFVDTVANVTGLNAYLVTAVALLVFLPFYWAVKQVLYHPFSSRKRWAGIVVLLLIAVGYNVGLYAATKDASFGFKSGVASKYYAVTPVGVRFFDRPGVDPNYGIPLQPVTRENIRDLELLRQGEFAPVDPAAARFFNPITGQAELWSVKDEQGFLVFYDKPGFDPRSGAALQPVTAGIYAEWKRARDAADQARKKAEEAAEAARRAALTEKARKAEDADRARRAAEDRFAAAEIECRIAAEERQRTKAAPQSPRRPTSSYAPSYVPYAWAGHSMFYSQPEYADALYEKCLREARAAAAR